MFRVELFCDDLKLHRVLQAIAGLALGNPNIQPVANAKKQGGKVVPRVTNGDRIQILAKELARAKAKTVTPNDLKAFAKAHGLAETSYSVILKQAIEYGVLKKKPGSKGKNMVYLVTVKGGAK